MTAVVTYAAALGVIPHRWRSRAREREGERERREAELIIVARDAELMRCARSSSRISSSTRSIAARADRRDPAQARTMVVRLADLMKAVSPRGHRARPARRELDLVRAYLDVERIRLGSRLSVAFDIDDAARGVLVPPLLLQPIVENAVKHGVAPYASPRFVEVQATIDRDRLRIVIRDAGQGPSAVPAARAFGTGRGLQITRSRLDGAYGDGYRLSLDREPSGTAVRIDVPAERLDVA